MNSEVLNNVNTAVQTVPPDMAHVMAAAVVIGGSIRLATSLMKMPVLGEMWNKIPWWGKPALLMTMALVSGLADGLASGQKWYLALGSALTGLGFAVTSHEFQSLFEEAKDREIKEAVAEAQRNAAAAAVHPSPPAAVPVVVQPPAEVVIPGVNGPVASPPNPVLPPVIPGVNGPVASPPNPVVVSVAVSVDTAPTAPAHVDGVTPAVTAPIVLPAPSADVPKN